MMDSSFLTLCIFMLAAYMCTLCGVYAYSNGSAKELAAANKNISTAIKKATDATDSMDVISARLTDNKISIQVLKEQVQALNEKAMSLGTKIEKSIVVTHQWPENTEKKLSKSAKSVAVVSKKTADKK